MNYKIIIQKAAEKFLKKQPKKIQERLLAAIYKLPEGTDIKKLQGHDMYRMRVGNIRVLYIVDEVIKIISIENIDNRGDIYKKLQKFIMHNEKLKELIEFIPEEAPFPDEIQIWIMQKKSTTMLLSLKLTPFEKEAFANAMAEKHAIN